MTISRKDYLQMVRDNKKVLVKMLKKEKYSGGTMICGHNSILCVMLKRDDSVTFIIDTDKERGCVVLEDLNEHLCVPRYTPETAKAWMKEELSFNSGYGDEDMYYKKVLSERELREALKANLMSKIETFSNLCKAMKLQGIESI